MAAQVAAQACCCCTLGCYGQNTGCQQQLSTCCYSNLNCSPAPAPAAGGGGGGPTTISLTGTGTSYSTAEGPIDPKFKEKRQVVGTYQGIKVWGPIDPPGQLGIWGQEVCIDFDICVADGACIEACPVNVYEWLETPGHPASDKKAFMIREKTVYFVWHVKMSVRLRQ